MIFKKLAPLALIASLVLPLLTMAAGSCPPNTPNYYEGKCYATCSNGQTFLQGEYKATPSSGDSTTSSDDSKTNLGGSYWAFSAQK
jgi:hypothetical protein